MYPQTWKHIVIYTAWCSTEYLPCTSTNFTTHPNHPFEFRSNFSARAKWMVSSKARKVTFMSYSRLQHSNIFQSHSVMFNRPHPMFFSGNGLTHGVLKRHSMACHSCAGSDTTGSFWRVSKRSPWGLFGSSIAQSNASLLHKQKSTDIDPDMSRCRLCRYPIPLLTGIWANDQWHSPTQKQQNTQTSENRKHSEQPKSSMAFYLQLSCTWGQREGDES